jgi:cytoskeleton protein RodZ
MLSIGEELRSLRQGRNLSLEDVAQSTRISKRFLEYIETNRFDQLPGGAFNRAFIKSYAQFLGMDPREALQQYSKHAPLPKEKSGRREPTLHRHRPLIRFVISTGFTVTLIVLGSLLLYREIRITRSEIEDAKSKVTTTLETIVIPPATLPPADSSAAPQTAASPATNQEPVPVAVQYPINLVIEAVNQCWISVNADGRQITSQLLARGDKLPFHANSQVALILGNAGGVNLRFNGNPLRKLGASGEVQKVVLTLDNYKDFLVEPTTPQP